MKRILLCVVAAAWTLAAIGCSPSDTQLSASEKEYNRLYKQYADRFHDKMAKEGDAPKPEQMAAEASRLWEETFGPHKALLKERAGELLKTLDSAPAIIENAEKVDGLPAATIGGTVYLEIATISRAPESAEAKVDVPKHLLWNPLNAAQVALNNWLMVILDQRTLGMRSLATNYASLTFEARDRSADTPRLVLRQGPSVFLVDLSRVDDFYRVDKIRWLKAKTAGSVLVPELRPAATAPAAPAPSAPPAAKPPEEPAEKPAAPPK